MQRACLRTVWFLWLIATLIQRGSAQEAPTTAEVLALVPPDAIGLVTIRPRLIAQDESLKLLPLEVVSASGLDHLGFDPLKVERIDAIVGLPGIAGPQFAALVAFSEDIPAEARQRFAKGQPQTKQGLELWPVEQAPGVVVYMKGPRQAVVGTEAYVVRLLKTKAVDGELRKLASGMSEPGHLSVIVALEPLRDMLTGFAQSPALQQVPEFGRDVATLAAKTKMIALRVQLGSKAVTAIALEAGNEADAAELDEALARMMDLLATAAVSGAEKEAALEPGRVSEAAVAYVNRLAAEMKRLLDFQRNGKRLYLKLEGDQFAYGQIGIMTGLLLPAVQAARQAARRMESANNMKQILLAIHNYESANKVVPGDTDKSKEPNTEGATNLSWRVKILPFLEQGELYNEFHHDEPWDSPHNIKLLERMPAVFKHPEGIVKPGYTVYQMPTGEHLANEPGKQLRFSDFSDGLSNTIAVVASRDEAAVPWTKPGDLELGSMSIFRDVIYVALMDGSVQMLPVDIAPEKLRAMLTRDGKD